jgi:hypothetical protein
LAVSDPDALPQLISCVTPITRQSDESVDPFEKLGNAEGWRQANLGRVYTPILGDRRHFCGGAWDPSVVLRRQPKSGSKRGLSALTARRVVGSPHDEILIGLNNRVQWLRLAGGQTRLRFGTNPKRKRLQEGTLMYRLALSIYSIQKALYYSALLGILVEPITGCGLYVPDKSPLISGEPDASSVSKTSPQASYENKIVEHINCELKRAGSLFPPLGPRFGKKQPAASGGAFTAL